MKPLPVYSLLPVTLTCGRGSMVYDTDGTGYLDLYGGHAVISLGHADEVWSTAIADHAATLGFYSNSVHLPIQNQAAEAIGRIAGREDDHVFFVNSGAEANENALKLASFVTGRTKIVAFHGAFHGRTSLAVAATGDPKLIAPVNAVHDVRHLPLNDIDVVRGVLAAQDVAAVIIEGIQGVGGCEMPTDDFLVALATECERTGTMLVLDEVQSGCGRTGQYFAHQAAGIIPPIVTMAKGIGNGFPVGAMIVDRSIDVRIGMLGTTFGGNPMACAATLAVVKGIEDRQLMHNAAERGAQLRAGLSGARGIVELRGRGLMIGVVLDRPCNDARTALWRDHHVLTGNASNPHVLRLLPPLSITAAEIDRAIHAIRTVVESAS